MNERRMRRAATLTAAVSTLAVIAVSAKLFAGGLDITAVWWTVVSVALVAAAAICLLIVSMRSARRPVVALRVAAVGLAVADLAAICLWFPAWSGQPAAEDGSPPVWVANAMVLPAIALVPLARLRWAVAYTVVALSLLSAAQQRAGFGADGVDAYANQVMTASMMVVFLVALNTAMTIARAVDVRRAQALAASVETAIEEARAAECRRLDTVVRDKVGAVLRDMTPGRPDPMIVGQARDALADLAGGLAAPTTPVDVPVETVVARLHEAVAAHDEDVMVAVEAAPDVDGLPVAAAEAVLAAVAESVGNAVRHAGAGASTVVVGHLGGDGVRIRIVDDGCGFDPDRVAPDRTGIAARVIGGLAAVPGGSAHVESGPDRGTMVSIEWARP